ncbi:hypothetical protein [Prosthecobacter dejongeii]|uniref:Uncharacterized protein n=1 Tax=Prosthecobacter dejongeii TaxID=48465 RepID=A0A7W7YHZ6_9BACT|nr:hypothetical protein [Prosthecobacter dejongeii]MBB5036225.1 hypothetical protein [Prosthecobacter dejongeii]
MRRHILPLLVLLLLLAGVACMVWLKPGPAKVNMATNTVSAEAPVAEQVAEVQPRPVSAAPVPLSSPPLDPARFRRAYLISLDGAKLGLENAEDIEGDFASPRRRQEEWTGMLRCRLISADGKVLAEELLPAPDHLCTVLDARDGTPKPVTYTPPGPVLFQLRLPRRADATRLDIARITGPGALARDLPLGSLSLLPP